MPTRIEAASTTGLVKTTDLAQSSGSSLVSQDGKVVRLGTNSGVSDTINPLYIQSAYLGGSAAANLLDDYEEGTWTAGSAVGTFNASDVLYTKVGRMVHFHVKGSFSNSSNTEDVEITGLPYAPSQEQVAGSAMWRDLNTNFQGGVVYVKTNGRILFFDDGTTAVGHNLLRHNEIGSSNEVVLSGTYFTS